MPARRAEYFSRPELPLERDRGLDREAAARDPLSFNLRSFNDRVSKDELVYKMPEGKLSGYDYNCRPTKIGVPLGRITRPCKPDESKLDGHSARQHARRNLRDCRRQGL